LQAIFAILEYFPNQTFPEAGSLALTLVAIMLPLSSIWAAASVSDPAPVYSSSAMMTPAGYSTAPSGASKTFYKSNPSSTAGDSTMIGSAYDRKGSAAYADLGTLGPNAACKTAVGAAPGDREAAGYGDCVTVEKGFSVDATDKLRG
jgi:hypothetical protein